MTAIDETSGLEDLIILLFQCDRISTTWIRPIGPCALLIYREELPRDVLPSSVIITYNYQKERMGSTTHVMVPTENDKQYARCGWEKCKSLLGIAVVVEQTSTLAFVSNRILLDLVGAVKRRQVEIRRSFVDP